MYACYGTVEPRRRHPFDVRLRPRQPTSKIQSLSHPIHQKSAHGASLPTNPPTHPSPSPRAPKRTLLKQPTRLPHLGVLAARRLLLGPRAIDARGLVLGGGRRAAGGAAVERAGVIGGGRGGAAGVAAAGRRGRGRARRAGARRCVRVRRRRLLRGWRAGRRRRGFAVAALRPQRLVLRLGVR